MVDRVKKYKVLENLSRLKSLPCMLPLKIHKTYLNLFRFAGGRTKERKTLKNLKN